MHGNTVKHRNFVLTLFVLSTLQVDFALAETPVTAFDVSLVVECRDVTPASEREKKTERKLVEAVFKISTSVKVGIEHDLKTVVYTISDDKTTKSLEVAAFIPKTELTTDVLDPIVVIEEIDKGVSGQASIRYQIVPSGTGQATADAGGNVHNSIKSTVQYKKLPPKSLLVASGTENRRHAVFFKFMPNTQTTLEGERVVSVIFSVPNDWKADWVYLKCEALSAGLFNRKVTSGLGGFTVGLYLVGEDGGRLSAHRLVEQQQALFDELAKTRNDKSWLSIAWEWVWFFSKLSIRQAGAATNNQLYELLKTKQHAEIEKGLPASVKERLDKLNAAKADIEKLSGTIK